MGKLLNLLEPQFPYLKGGDNNQASLNPVISTCFWEGGRRLATFALRGFIDHVPSLPIQINMCCRKDSRGSERVFQSGCHEASTHQTGPGRSTITQKQALRTGRLGRPVRDSRQGPRLDLAVRAWYSEQKEVPTAYLAVQTHITL